MQPAIRSLLRPLAAFLLALPLHCQAQAVADCASTISQLRAIATDPGFPQRWEETSMEDGKPLVVSIVEREGALFLEFTKTGEGLWAEGLGRICRAGAGLEARFAGGQLRLGPAAHWVLKMAMGKDGRFTLQRGDGGQLRIATTGWSGTFAPRR